MRDDPETEDRPPKMFLGAGAHVTGAEPESAVWFVKFVQPEEEQTK